MGLHVTVAGGNDSNVDLDRNGATDTVDFPFLDGAQQLRLQARVHLGDFVEEYGATAGFLEFSDSPGDGAGEGALLMSEQLGFEQILGDRCTVHRDELLLGARAPAMNEVGQQFLAGARFAGDQDARARRRHRFRQPQHLDHGGVAIDDCMAFLGDRLENGGDEVGLWWQRDELARACLDGVDRGFGVGVHAAGDHRNIDALGRETDDESRDVELDVDHHEFGPLTRAQGVERGLYVVRMADLRAAVHGNPAGSAEFPAE